MRLSSRMKLPYLLLASLLSAAGLHAAEPAVLPVPFGKTPLLNGRVAPGEWDDSARLDLPEGATLFVKQTEDYLFVCLKPAQPLIFGMDLLLADEAGQRIDLHASAYIGERSPLPDGSWPDFNWWNNEHWTASFSGFLRREARNEYMPSEAREYQLSRRHFSAARYRIFLSYDLTRGRGQATSFPADASDADPSRWLPLELAQPAR